MTSSPPISHRLFVSALAQDAALADTSADKPADSSETKTITVHVELIPGWDTADTGRAVEPPGSSGYCI